MKKIVAIVIINLVLIAGFIQLPCIYASINKNKLNQIDVSKNIELSNACITGGNTPLPPVIWTEDFFTFYISVPQNPDNDQIYYLIEWGDGTGSGWVGPYLPGETVYLSHVWGEEGNYKINAKAKDQDGESRWAIFSLSLSSDFKFFGVETGYVNITYIFTMYLKQCEYFIFFDWGDGTSSNWLGPYNETFLCSHSWSATGEYLLRFKMKDIYGNESNWISLLIHILSLENNAPKAPIIKGPTGVKPGTYEYSFNSTDPDGDQVKYYIDWGDGNNSGWIGPYNSGEEVKLNHSFLKIRIYLIRAKAMDPDNYESKWSVEYVVISKSNHQSIITLLFHVIKRLLIIR